MLFSNCGRYFWECYISNFLGEIGNIYFYVKFFLFIWWDFIYILKKGCVDFIKYICGVYLFWGLFVCYFDVELFMYLIYEKFFFVCVEIRGFLIVELI